MKKYLIALDLDGTLLNDESIIPEQTKLYLQNLQQIGHKIVIATGRPHRGTINYYQELQLTTPMITENGIVIHPENDTTFTHQEKRIPYQLVDNIVKFLDGNLVTAFFNIKNKLYTFNPLKEIEFYYHLNEHSKIIEGPINNKDYPEPYLLLLAINSDVIEEFEQFIITNSNNYLNYRRWWSNKQLTIYEIYINACSKGKSLLKVAKHYNIPQEDIISFGDGSNDIELLKVAGLGVKMINGSKRLTHYDDLTILDNNNEGVMHYLKTIVKV